MTGGEVFAHTFKDVWFKFQDPQKKTPSWIKVYTSLNGYNKFDTSNCRVIQVHPGGKLGKSRIKAENANNIKLSLITLSYYKLFNNCVVESNQEKLNELIVIEAKLRLMN